MDLPFLESLFSVVKNENLDKFLEKYLLPTLDLLGL
jgi:hypothetical protein